MEHRLAFQKDDECANADFPLYIGLEFGVKSFPGLLLCIVGTIRYCEIKDVAKSSVRYRKLFKAKVGICATMAFVCFAYMIVVFATPANVNLSSWINQCDKEFYALIFIV